MIRLAAHPPTDFECKSNVLFFMAVRARWVH